MWSSIARIAKDRLINDIFFLIYDKVHSGVDETQNFALRIQEHRRICLDRDCNGITSENNRDFCEYLINTGYELLVEFYKQYAERYPIDEEYEQYVCDEVDVKDQIGIILMARNHLKLHEQSANCERTGRRWQTHPLNQERGNAGFWAKILPELIKYREFSVSF